MADANLLEALKMQGRNGCLENIKLYGRVRCAIKRPSVIGSKLETVEGGAFAILDVYALKCLGEDYFRSFDVSSQSIYFTKGSMIIYIDSPKWVGKDVKVGGTSIKNGVKIRQQLNASTPYDGISALVFRYVNGNFLVIPNSIADLVDNDPDIRSTTLEDFIVNIKKNETGIIEYPVTLDSIVSYKAVEDYEELVNVQEEKKTEYIDNGERVDISSINLNLTHHLNAQDLSPIYDDVKEEISSMSKKRKEYVKKLMAELRVTYRENYEEFKGVANKIRFAFVNSVARSYFANIGNSAIKGGVYVNDLINSLVGKPVGEEDLKDEKVSMSKLKEQAENLIKMVQVDPDCLKNTEIEGIGLPMLEDDRQFSLIVIAITTGVGLESLKANYSLCNKATNMLFDDWFFMLLNNPYALGMIGSSLNIVDCDKIYFSYTRFFTNGIWCNECGEMRSDLLYLQTLEDADDKDTLIKPSELARQTAKYPSIGSRFLSMNQFPAKKDLVEVLSAVCGNRVELSDAQLNYLQNMRWYSKARTESLIERGIVNTIDDMIMLERDLEKEFLIYDVLISKGSQVTGITEEQVNKTIESFEQSRGFQLESLQKDGIKLTMYKAGVLSGCAGSGKTTTCDCMVDCIKEYRKTFQIVFCTPTGKACRRLAEVVHAPVKTIHSQFGVGLGGESYISDVRRRYVSSDASKKAYFLDEMAMCTTTLLYEVVRNLSDGDLIYFLGDIKQLTPIGKGNPFFLLMKMLPCVELGVSKRAAEGSKVNYNTTLINHMSDGAIRELLFDDNSFICRECPDADIPRIVVNTWGDLMSGNITGSPIKEEDIQVISGYAKEGITFSTTALNKPLQKFLRSSDKLLFRHVEDDFYQNERVIHVKSNYYGMPRYVEVNPGVYKEVVTLGIMNGEVGTLEGVMRTDMVNIIPFENEDLELEPIYEGLSKEDKDKLLDIREGRAENIRDDYSLNDQRTYFVKVRVYDVDLQRDVYIFYIGRMHEYEEILTLSGAELGFIELAYALTTHKMQGSQNKAVILPFGTSCSSMFINRNMINTMVTRSEGVVCMVGTVRGADSPVARGRMYPSPAQTSDMLSLLCEEEE